MSRRSRRVSTSTNGPSAVIACAGRSRGTWAGLGSNAMAAFASAILPASELTHCRPEPCAICAKSCKGRSYAITLGKPEATGAARGAASTGALAGTGATAAAVGTSGLGVLAGCVVVATFSGASGLSNGWARALFGTEFSANSGAWETVDSGSARAARSPAPSPPSWRSRRSRP